jgi:hypothetical protein
LLDLVANRVVLSHDRGGGEVAIAGKSVAAVRAECWRCSRPPGCRTDYHAAPNEDDPAVPFAADVEARGPYDPDSAARQLPGRCLSADRGFPPLPIGGSSVRSARCTFSGAASTWPVTRFSGRQRRCLQAAIPNPVRCGDARGV